MPFEDKDRMERRIEFVVRAAAGVETMTSLCAAFGISRQTGYTWLRRYEQVGSVGALAEGSRRPHVSPRRTDAGIERRVAELRAEYGWGAEKIAVLLAREKCTVPVRTIGHILKRLGLIAPEDVPQPANKRFERARPNELWQTDFKGEYRSPHGTCYPLTILDDHSRFNVGLFALPNIRTETVFPCFITAFERHGVPEALLCDHGAPWYATHAEHGLTAFAVRLIEQSVRLLHGRPRHPQTQGKIERFHRTIDRHIAHRGKPEYFDQWQPRLDAFREEYNHVRPHHALELDVPAKRYQNSPRAYEPTPAPYPYTGDAPVLLVNSAGNINYQGRQYFVSQALAAKLVQLHELNEGLVIRFRHMFVRETDPRTGIGKPILYQPEDNTP